MNMGDASEEACVWGGLAFHSLERPYTAVEQPCVYLKQDRSLALTGPGSSLLKEDTVCHGGDGFKQYL